MLASLIIIGVIALVTVATLQLANISKQQAAKDARSLSQVACVEAARQYVLSRLRLFGAPATSITLDQAIVVGTGSTGFLSAGYSYDAVELAMEPPSAQSPARTSQLAMRGAQPAARTPPPAPGAAGAGALGGDPVQA